MIFTSRGYITLWRDGVQISRHLVAEEAYERAHEHAQEHGSGRYTVRYPESDIDVMGLFVSRTKSAGNNNPDGWGTSGTIYVNRNFDTENSPEIGTANAVFDRSWSSTIGRGSSGAWKCWPLPGGEQNAGWPNSWGANTPRQIFHSFTMKITQGMYTNVWNATGATWMKFLDLTQASDTSGNHRWVTSLSVQGKAGAVDATGMQFGFRSGGAGTALHSDGVNTNPDLTAFIFDEFVWFCIVYDEQNTTAHMYMKRQGDAGVTKILERDETTVYGSEFFQSTGGGWDTTVSFAGYWDFGTGFTADSANNYMVIDDLVISNYWTGPVW